MRLALISTAAVLALGGCASVSPAPERAARAWVTTGDRTQLLAEQPPPASLAAGDDLPVVTVDVAQRDQAIVGFGASITDASAWLIQTRMSASQRQALLSELFGRGEGGLGFSFTRVTIGASDFSLDHYSLDDAPEIVVAVLRALPLTPVVDLMRLGWLGTTGEADPAGFAGVFGEALIPAGILVAWIVVCLVAVRRRFRWEPRR